MIVDTSLLLAIVFREPGFERLVQELTEADAVAAGTPTLAETDVERIAGDGEPVLHLEARVVRFI